MVTAAATASSGKASTKRGNSGSNGSSEKEKKREKLHNGGFCVLEKVLAIVFGSLYPGTALFLIYSIFPSCLADHEPDRQPHFVFRYFMGFKIMSLQNKSVDYERATDLKNFVSPILWDSKLPI